MLLVLTTGLGLWVTYGAIKGDWMIIIANSVSIGCLAVLIYFKLFGVNERRPAHAVVPAGSSSQSTWPQSRQR
jgi:sugar efflux transporter for intercellular exchange